MLKENISEIFVTMDLAMLIGYDTKTKSKTRQTGHQQNIKCALWGTMNKKRQLV